jgi:hypothetical protein
LSDIHDMCGLGLAPDNRKPAAHINVLLGVEGDLTAFKAERQVSSRPTRRRCRAIWATLETCRKTDKMRPCEAANPLGRLTLALLSSYTSVSREATRPLVDRVSDRAEGRGAGAQDRHRWTQSMTHMLGFFEALFADLPDLSFNFREKHKKKVIIYTDVSFSPSRNGLGFIVFDQETGSRYVCDAPCPAELMEKWNALDENPWFLREFTGNQTLQTHVNSMELLAILTAVWTVGPDMLQDREVLFFCDNTIGNERGSAWVCAITQHGCPLKRTAPRPGVAPGHSRVRVGAIGCKLRRYSVSTSRAGGGAVLRAAQTCALGRRHEMPLAGSDPSTAPQRHTGLSGVRRLRKADLVDLNMLV